MKIDPSLNNSLSATSSNRINSDTQTSFQALLNKTVGTTTSTPATPVTTTPASTPDDKQAKRQATYEAALAEFRDYMSKTPAERMRDAILKGMGLTEEDLAAMPPEEQAAVEAEISQKFKEWMLAADTEQNTVVSGAQVALSGNSGLDTSLL